MKHHWITLACLLLLLQQGHSQSASDGNLVFNPSFEEHSECPQRVDAIGIMRGVDAWWQPTKGSSDYFHACGGRECLTPRNKMGMQAPHTGDAYCGIYTSKENYREYLQTELKQPLVAGATYRVSFWVSLADKSPHAVATLGALLTSERPTDTTWSTLTRKESIALEEGLTQSIVTHFVPQIVNPTDHVLDNPTAWTEVSGEFVAAGGERYLTLGNFNSFNHSHVVYTNANNAILPGAYYYIDDVSVVCLSTPTVPSADTVQALHRGDVLTLHNVLFETDKSDLLPQSYNELHALITLLNKYPTMRIELHGHTDNQGTAEHNRKLSEARAQAVAEYLISRGIDKKRLVWRGFGKTRPIDTNDTPEGRQHNRRVEYLVVEE